MNEKFKYKIIDMLKSFRIWLLIFFVICSLIAINFTFDKESVLIDGISLSSLAQNAGFVYDSNSNLRGLEKILSVNDKKINNKEDYFNAINNLKNNSKVLIKTNKKIYELDFKFEKNKTNSQIIGISVRDSVSSNIKLGIELEGGSRIILKPKTNLTVEQLDILTTTIQNRLDIYGVSGTHVSKLEDSFSNQKFIIVESTSSNKADIFNLIKRQGKFLAKINNVSVFNGENVLTVFSDPQHSGLESCIETDKGFVCKYTFSIEIDSIASSNFFNQTKRLDSHGSVLSEKIYFYLDGKEITALSVSSTFKNQKVTTPQISVSGDAKLTKNQAIKSAEKEMKIIKSILSTKTLPSELEVVQNYSISNSLGKSFLENSFLVGITALFLVSLIVALRYRKMGIFFGIFIALISEVIIVFGIAAFMKLTIDLAAIGGLIAAIGTGVDDQIIITDEYFRKQNKNKTSKKKIKSALYIILIAYCTTLAAMIPLMFAGLKMLQGFAFMILIGVTIGVFITRPAYSVILRILMTSRKQRKEELEIDMQD